MESLAQLGERGSLVYVAREHLAHLPLGRSSRLE